MKILISLLFLLAPQAIHAQSKINWGFMNGVIHLKKGDSLLCLVERQVAYGQTILYKLSQNGDTKEISLAELNYFTANKKTFKVVSLNNGLQVMEVLDTGKIAIYTFNEIKYQPTKRNISAGTKTTKGDIFIHYVINKAGTIQEVKEPDFKVVLKQLFNDCQRMAGKVSRGDYLFEDMQQIIRDYNNCKGEYCEHTTSAAQPG
ncbi:MAG: hypothetical protein EOP53_10180 [Sphingobacteriales bacterium]|nr:MAG: hypothetical protein EOP53_10180 [Sphingobacteriales bacterium]